MSSLVTQQRSSQMTQLLALVFSVSHTALHTCAQVVQCDRYTPKVSIKRFLKRNLADVGMAQ